MFLFIFRYTCICVQYLDFFFSLNTYSTFNITVITLGIERGTSVRDKKFARVNTTGYTPVYRALSNYKTLNTEAYKH